MKVLVILAASFWLGVVYYVLWQWLRLVKLTMAAVVAEHQRLSK